MKQNGLILGLALTILRPDRLPGVLGRRTPAAPGAADGFKCWSSAGQGEIGLGGARVYGQRVVKRMRGLGAGAARLEGLREFAKDAAAYALSFLPAAVGVPGHLRHGTPDPSSAGQEARAV